MADRSFAAACVQSTSGDDVGVNVKETCRLIRLAWEQGADMVFLPENVAMMAPGRRALVAAARSEEEHPALAAFRSLVRELKIWLHCGTIHVPREDGRLANRSLVLSPDGTVVARYDKIHMFDASVSGDEIYCESATFSPGDEAVVVDLPWGRLGLSICYDVRFPALYRALAKAGAEILAVPAAFTRLSGQAHWHVLQRARAIETGCFVLAPAQTGDHAGGRQTFGHALIIEPWGGTLADAGTEPGIVAARLDLSQVAEARRRIPSLEHDRDFTVTRQG